MSNQQLQTSKQNTIKAYFTSPSAKSEMAKVLPKHLTPDRMTRVFLTAIIRNPSLLNCTQESLWESMMILSQLGLEPDGRQAHLVPYGNKCTAIPDYKGFVSRAKENGVIGIHYDNVFTNDVFQWDITGDGLQFKHSPHIKTPDRGEMFAAYCIWRDGEGKPLQGVIMTKLEIDAIRNNSPGKNSPAWVKSYFEQTKKTAVRRAAKQWPMDVKLQKFADAGKILTSAEALDIEAFVEPEAIQISNDDSNPDLNPAKPKEQTPREFVVKSLTDAGVEFDQLRAYLSSKNIYKDADSLASYDEIPDAAIEVLKQQKTLADIIKIYGKK